RSGQSSHVLVGAAFQTEHPDMLLAYELGGFLQRDGWSPLWERQGRNGGGVVTGSGAAFLVLESREHAQKRNRTPYAAISRVMSDRTRRRDDNLRNTVEQMVESLAGSEPMMAICGASGAHQPTTVEKSILDASDNLAVRGFGALTGHLKEAQFPFAVALAALALHNGQVYPAFDAERERPLQQKPAAVLATAIG